MGGTSNVPFIVVLRTPYVEQCERYPLTRMPALPIPSLTLCHKQLTWFMIQSDCIVCLQGVHDTVRLYNDQHSESQEANFTKYSTISKRLALAATTLCARAKHSASWLPSCVKVSCLLSHTVSSPIGRIVSSQSGKRGRVSAWHQFLWVMGFRDKH